jgi:hypothetical protein
LTWMSRRGIIIMQATCYCSAVRFFTGCRTQAQSRSGHAPLSSAFFISVPGTDSMRRLASPVSFAHLSARRSIVARCLCRSSPVLTSCLHSLAKVGCIFPPSHRTPRKDRYWVSDHLSGQASLYEGPWCCVDWGSASSRCIVKIHMGLAQPILANE